MTQLEIATIIGGILTGLDQTLQSPRLSDEDWHKLFALRKHLDDEQRDLIRSSIEASDESYADLTQALQTANENLTEVINDVSKVNHTIDLVAKVASILDQLLKLAAI